MPPVGFNYGIEDECCESLKIGVGGSISQPVVLVLSAWVWARFSYLAG